jgi:hypothetical protein
MSGHVLWGFEDSTEFFFEIFVSMISRDIGPEQVKLGSYKEGEVMHMCLIAREITEILPEPQPCTKVTTTLHNVPTHTAF